MSKSRSSSATKSGSSSSAHGSSSNASGSGASSGSSSHGGSSSAHGSSSHGSSSSASGSSSHGSSRSGSSGSSAASGSSSHGSSSSAHGSSSHGSSSSSGLSGSSAASGSRGGSSTSMHSSGSKGSAGSTKRSANVGSKALRVRKPKAVLLDLVGSITKSNWIDKMVFPYVRQNVDTYLANNWGKRVLMRDIELLRAESTKDGGPAIAPPSDIQEKIRPSVVAYVHRCLAEVVNHEAFRIFSMHMIFDGLNRGKLVTAVYTDAAEYISKWPSQGIEVHMLSNGWSYATQKFLSKTNHSDLTPHIKSYMDTSLGSLEDPATYKAVVSKLGLPAEDVIFLTHCGMEGVAAHQAGLSVILVTTHREDVRRERTSATVECGLPFIRIFSELSFGEDAPVASSMVDQEAMSRAVSASRISNAGGSSGGGSSSHMSGSKSSSAGSSSRGSSSASGSHSSSSASGSSSKGSSSCGGSSSRASGSKSSSSVGSRSRGSSSASGSHSSSSAASGSSASSGSSSKGGSSSASGSKHSSH